MTNRTATPAEIIADRDMQIRHGWKVSYRHFTHERSCPGAKHGVKHITKTASKIVIKDGVPYVRYMGQLQELTATVVFYKGDSITREFITDYRIKSEYLKGEFE